MTIRFWETWLISAYFSETRHLHVHLWDENFCRKFYEYQDKLIEGYEEVAKNSNDKYTRLRKLQKKTNLYAKISFAANLVSSNVSTLFDYDCVSLLLLPDNEGAAASLVNTRVVKTAMPDQHKSYVDSAQIDIICITGHFPNEIRFILMLFYSFRFYWRLSWSLLFYQDPWPSYQVSWTA